MTASEIENDHFDLDHFDRYCVHERIQYRQWSYLFRHRLFLI